MLLATSGCLLFSPLTPGHATGITLPKNVLWAWQRAEDLSLIDPKEFGVAYFACHIVLVGDTARIAWRDQPLKLPKHAVVVPVLRIDTDRKQPPALCQKQCDAVVNVLARMSRIPNAAQVQIDFDALQTERAFYRQLVQQSRLAIAPEMPISITALASWCLFDNWIKDLPVDETVPMMFSLGRDRAKVLDYFRARGDYLVSGCCKSLGISLEEPDVNQLMIPLAGQRKMPVRVYVFTRHSWNDKKIKAVQSMLSKS